MPGLVLGRGEGFNDCAGVRENVGFSDFPGYLDLIEVCVLAIEVRPVDQEFDLVGIGHPRDEHHLVTEPGCGESTDALLAEHPPTSVTARASSLGVGRDVEP